MLTHEEQDKIFAGLLKRKENAFCAECGSKSPCWASLEFGVFVCLNCSGAHRALSPSVTRVKSVRLDTWSREWLENMQLGNTNLNLYWQHLLSDHHGAKPNQNSTIDFLIRFVKDKYVRRLYVDPSQPTDPLSRFKMNPNCKPEVFLAKRGDMKDVGTKERPVISSSSPKPARLQKATTINAPMSAVVSSKRKQKQADFSFFDDIMINKKPNKVQTNLISFQETQKKTGFDDFEFKEKPKEERYNKQQFMSMGGIKPNKPKPQANFDLFPSNPQSTNIENFINFQTEKNVATTSFNDYNFPTNQYNKAQFTSMGGYSPSGDFNQGKVNFGQAKVNSNTGNMANGNWFGSQYFGVQLQKHKMPPRPPPQKITLEVNINLQTVEKDKKVTSWVDQWK